MLSSDVAITDCASSDFFHVVFSGHKLPSEFFKKPNSKDFFFSNL